MGTILEEDIINALRPYHEETLICDATPSTHDRTRSDSFNVCEMSPQRGPSSYNFEQ